MHQLDAFGRLAPSSLDVSRAAARRHEQLSALRERERTLGRSLPPRHPQQWFRRPRPRVLRLLLG